MVSPFTNTSIGVGFGTAALGDYCYDVVMMALQEGFRKFDTAEENEYWYDQKSVGEALKDFFTESGECMDTSSESHVCGNNCDLADVRVSTKIPPWSLTSQEDIRASAAQSRQDILGFCSNEVIIGDNGEILEERPFPLDVYYIHAPQCWPGWHPQCDDPPDLLDLRSAWVALEAVVGVDHNARRIGLSNVRVSEVLDIIKFVDDRTAAGAMDPPPRIPDAIQSFYDPISPDEELKRVCEENGIEFVSYSTLGTQHRSSSHNPVLSSPIIQRLAAKHARSTAEVILSWALQSGMSVIPRSGKRHHIKELARLLPGEEATFLDAGDIVAVDSMKHTA